MTLARLFDERHPEGGRIKGLLFLTHPGPSVLVTAVTAAAAALLGRRSVGVAGLVGVVLIMLPMQLAIGALNDWADRDADLQVKPYKPLARGTVSPGTALAVAAGGFAVSLSTAAHWGITDALIALLGIVSGAAYDLGLKRTPLSFLCFWGGLQCVALLAISVASVGGGLITLPLGGVLALALHLSNALPDIDGDRAVGAMTVPALLGAGLTRWVIVLALAAAAGYAGIAVATARVGPGALVGVVSLAAAALLTASLPAAVLRRCGFALLALLAAAASITWLGALPAAVG